MIAIWWLVPILVPLVGAMVALLSRPARVWLPTLAPAPALVLALVGAPGSAAQFSWLLFETRLELDPIARLLLVMTALVWSAAGASARRLTADGPAFAALFLLTMAGNIGLLLAADVVSLYTSFALMTFAAYGLVVHDRTPQAMRAGRVYVVLAVIGEVALLSGLVFAVAAAGATGFEDVRAALPTAPHRHLIIGLLLGGFGIKAGMVPLHVWLPLAHPAAPVPASAVLSGAMIKAGLVGWLRVLPLGELAFPGWAATLVGIGITTAFVGIAVGVVQSDPKVLLAYSSISQMGLIATVVGVGLAVPAAAGPAALAATIYAFHHGFAKAALFLGVGVRRAGIADLRRHRVLLAGMGLAALSLAGAPLTSGWVAKQATKATVGALPDPEAATLTLLLSLAAAGTTLLMARLLLLVGRPVLTATPRRPLLVPWAVTVVGGVAAATWIVPSVVVPGIQPPTPGLSGLWDGTWPVLLGVALVAGWRWVGRRRPLRVPEIPPGDLIVLLEAAVPTVTAGGRRGLAAADATVGWLRAVRDAAYLVVRPGAGFDRAEDRLTRWRSAGVVFGLVGAALLLALFGGGR